MASNPGFRQTCNDLYEDADGNEYNWSNGLISGWLDNDPICLVSQMSNSLNCEGTFCSWHTLLLSLYSWIPHYQGWWQLLAIISDEHFRLWIRRLQP